VIGNGGTLLISNVVATLQTTDQQLLVTNGGRVTCTVAAGGFNTNSSGFTVTINGTNALWSSRTDFAVGYNGTGNGLVSSGGGEGTAGTSYVGYAASAVDNAALVSGTRSVWSNATLHIGYNGAGNSLVISNGGLVWMTNGYIGANVSAGNNRVLITDPGSV